MDPICLSDTYLHVHEGTVRTVPVDASFWSRIHERRDLDDGHLLMRFRFERSWETWERHPAGDEIVVVLSGALTLVLDHEDGQERVTLEAGRTGVIPRGVWHTADVTGPCEALFLTPGRGTTHRRRTA